MAVVCNLENSFTDASQQNALLNMVPCGLCNLALDPELTILGANDCFYSLFHYTREQALYANFTNLCFAMLETDFSALLEEIQQALIQHHDLFEKELRFSCRNGQVKSVLIRCYLQRTPRDKMLWTFTDLTQQKYMQRKVRLSEEMCNAASRQFNTILAYYDLAASSLSFLYSFGRTWGIPSVIHNLPDSILGCGLLSPSSKKILRDFFISLSAGQPFGSCVIQARKSASSHYLWFGIKYTLAPASDNIDTHAIITIKNITAEREKEIAYEKWLQNYTELKRDCFAYFECDLTNDHLEKTESRNTMIHQLVHEISTYSDLHAHAAFNFVYEDDKDCFFQTFTREHLLSIYYTGQYRASNDFRFKNKNGQLIWYSCTAQLVSDPYAKSVRAFVTIKNIDIEKQELLQLKESSRKDSLTGLLNRRALTERICQALLIRSALLRAFIIVDLDHFKHINDSNGHQFGDKVLKDVGMTLQSCIAPTDICGRLGGDEFVLFLQNISTSKQLGEQISLLSAHICHRYANGISLSACMGIAVIPTDGGTFEELYKKSDTALYQAKHIGAGNYMFSGNYQNCTGLFSGGNKNAIS